MPSVIVYDKQFNKIAVLENAYNVGYEKRLNELWTARFTMPADDSKNQYCDAYNLVEIYDGDERVELFRIMPSTRNRQDIDIIEYACEHTLATLIDDVLFQYHEIGGTGVFTQTVLEYVLNQQTVTNWVLGVNDFSRQFQYSWENENLLGALFSIPNRFVEKYQWTFDTTSYPFTINLKSIDTDSAPELFLRYGKNLQGITKETDTTELCTRLYALGYGEGVNQLTIESVNDNLPYLDASTIGEYGVISRIFVDRRFEDAQSLKARAQAILSELQVPRVTYTLAAADISNITNFDWDKAKIGTIAEVFDDELGKITALVMGIDKPNLTENPADVVITLANKPQDIASSISDLADRQRINEVYSQGATNLNTYNFADNCDNIYPAEFQIYIPLETVRINKVLLSYKTSAFRAYSRAIDGGGSFVDTTAAGGGVATSTASGGGIATSTAAGGGTSTSTASGGGSFQTISFDDSGSVNFSRPLDSFKSFIQTSGQHTHPDVEVSGQHFHTIFDFRLNFNVPNHTHSISISDHNHSISIPNHTHAVSLSNHTHGISIPNHTHNIEQGIFEGGIPTSLALEVDGNIVAGAGLNATDIDIVPFLAKDGGGKIIRGWHTITIKPNNLARITADVAVQLFIQSRGGGDF